MPLSCDKTLRGKCRGEMKILCETNVAVRSSHVKGRFQKTTLVLGRKAEGSNVSIILVHNNKNGNRYDLNNNIANIFRRFIDDGKCTISFKVPEIDLQIKADPIQLKALMNAIKTQLSPQQTTDTKQLSLSNTNKITAIEHVTKLVVKERAGFAAKGFPRTLKELTINEVGCSQMPIGILNLTNLHHLDLSCNNISRLPRALGRLKLSTMKLDQNQFGESTMLRDWDWLTGDNIRKSLTSLSVTRNKLKFIPPSLLKCANLIQLDLSHNEITYLPFAVKQLNRLKILNLSDNGLTSLPYTITKLYFDVIDLSSNQFPSEGAAKQLVHQNLSTDVSLKFRSLLELSANVIIKHQIPFLSHNIPRILENILMHSPLCVNSKCESLCFDRPTLRSSTIIQLNAKQRVTSDNASTFLADGPLCSSNCGKTVFKKFFPRRSANW